MKFNVELAKRFVSDYKLPIPIVTDEHLFNYYLSLFEKQFQTKSKYEKLCILIDRDFDSKSDKFLKEYYDIRESIIQTVNDNIAYQKFNNMDMNVYAIKDKINISSNNIYNYENTNKVFISIDLKKANFQALKFVNPDIIYNANSYEDFIGHFTNLDYIKNSKYTRQVIFGKMNPKRHITVEKYIINEIRKLITDIEDITTLVSMSTDELVYELTVPIDAVGLSLEFDLINIQDRIKHKLNIDVSIEVFKLKSYEVYSNTNDNIHKHFFVKKYLNESKKEEFKCIPEPFFPLFYKLYNGLEIQNEDRIILYEGMTAYLRDDFQIKEL